MRWDRFGAKKMPVFHALTPQAALHELDSSLEGLSGAEAAARLAGHGPNRLPQAQPPTLAAIILHQFKSPLIYVLLAAAAVSIATGHPSDAAFIAAVLLLNAGIGAYQEFSAERSAQALQSLVKGRAHVRRDGASLSVDAQDLVPGDLVLLESGDRVPADLRLLECIGLSLDEALLTGESLPVSKDPMAAVGEGAGLGDRKNMAFAGSLVARGRGLGVVTATASGTALGAIAQVVMGKAQAKPPLLLRMEDFSNKVALSIGVAVILLGALLLWRGEGWATVFLTATALAVAAIPEGLPVALTVALAISLRRMSRRNVIVRRLVAVEALGSCTCIASDKTGTLTLNQMTVRKVDAAQPAALALAVGLCNESERPSSGGRPQGDAVDLALLEHAEAQGHGPHALGRHRRLGLIPFESERRYAAVAAAHPDGGARVHVKGALEALLPLCTTQAGPDGEQPLDPQGWHARVQSLAQDGHRVLAVAEGPWDPGQTLEEGKLQGLSLLGLVGMMDPPRPESRAAVEASHQAGIRVLMVTGDHPATSLAVARELGICDDEEQVASGPSLKQAQAGGEAALDALVERCRVFSRVEPEQKLAIVQSLQRLGHYVAVTGDGANDAPALRAAQVGVAMGKGGTDVARETASLILTDDNFASIVGGIEEGRVAYANVRKVVFFLISSGFSYILFFMLALLAGLPAPLVAVQLLWLNLVTNGIQDVALAFEPPEGGELAKAPRPPSEPMFDRLMSTRVLWTGTWMGLLTFGYYWWELAQGVAEETVRSHLVLLLVILGNLHVGNSRSETRSMIHQKPWSNPILLGGVAVALCVHLFAMHWAPLAGLLRLQPVPLADAGVMLGLGVLVLLAEEGRKAWAVRRSG
jgi:calcium-translocating P-type ATPase